MACTKATPDFDVLDEDRVPRPKFSGATTKTIQTYSDALTFQINGECDPKIRNIIGSAIGTSTTFSNINALTVSGINVTCATDNKFSFELKSLAALGYTVTEGAIYEIQLRAETSGGVSKPSYIRILYTSAAGGNRPILITSGGTGAALASNGNISASIRVSNKRNSVAGQSQSEDAFLKEGPVGSDISAHIGVRIHQ